MFATLSRVGRAFMLPVALLPAAGIFLGVGASFTTEAVITQLGNPAFLQDGTVIHAILTIMKNAGEIIFANLPVLFAIGVALGLAKKEKGTAALAGFVFFIVMHVVVSSALVIWGEWTALGTVTFVGQEITAAGLTSEVGIENTLAMGVFGGMLAGIITAALHNKFIDFKMPEVLGFFGGPRFIPIVSAATAIIVGLLMALTWPFIGSALNSLGEAIASMGSFASLFHGMIERALIPFGLHHVYYTPLWFTEVGGVQEIGGELVAGTNLQFFAHLANGTLDEFTSTNFMTGKFPFMIFGLPGAALAMYHTAKPENKKTVGALVFSAAFTAALTGITEPIEFTFLFVAPALYYLVHVPLAGLSFFLMDILNVTVGQTFSGGIIDLILFGVLPGQAATNWMGIILVGIPYFFIYYFIFRFAITKFDLKTPGREEVDSVNKAAGNATDNELALKIVDALGGNENISDIDACITRLRVTVKDPKLVAEQKVWQNDLGAGGLVMKGTGVQVIYGAKAAQLKTIIEEM